MSRSKIMTQDEFIHHTSELVAIPSTLDNSLALQHAATYVADFISTRTSGVTIEWFEQNGISSFLAYKGKTRPEKFDILLNCHADVVPATPEQFMPFVKEGKLYGRGALDMKGTTIVLASLFCELVNDVPYSLGFQLVSDEENSGYNGVHYQVNQGVRTDFAIMGEYANDKHTIYNAARGICWVEIAFRGKTAHGGHPWKGDNAIVRAGNFINEILRRYPIPQEETWTTTATISSVSTPNDTYNQIPDYAVVKVDFRFTNDNPEFHDEPSLKKMIASIDPEAEVIDIATFGRAVHARKDNPYVKGLHAAMESVTGIGPDYRGRPASSDARHFAAINVECIEFGLYGHNSHSADEYVEIASFDEYQQEMRRFLKNPKAA